MTEDEKLFISQKSSLSLDYFEDCPICKREKVGNTFSELVIKTHPNFRPKNIGEIPSINDVTMRLEKR